MGKPNMERFIILQNFLRDRLLMRIKQECAHAFMDACYDAALAYDPSVPHDWGFRNGRVENNWKAGDTEWLA